MNICIWMMILSIIIQILNIHLKVINLNLIRNSLLMFSHNHIRINSNLNLNHLYILMITNLNLIIYIRHFIIINIRLHLIMIMILIEFNLTFYMSTLLNHNQIIIIKVVNNVNLLSLLLDNKIIYIYQNTIHLKTPNLLKLRVIFNNHINHNYL